MCYDFFYVQLVSRTGATDGAASAVAGRRRLGRRRRRPLRRPGPRRVGRPLRLSSASFCFPPFSVCFSVSSSLCFYFFGVLFFSFFLFLFFFPTEGSAERKCLPCAQKRQQQQQQQQRENVFLIFGTHFNPRTHSIFATFTFIFFKRIPATFLFRSFRLPFLFSSIFLKKKTNKPTTNFLFRSSSLLRPGGFPTKTILSTFFLSLIPRPPLLFFFSSILFYFILIFVLTRTTTDRSCVSQPPLEPRITFWEEGGVDP